MTGRQATLGAPGRGISYSRSTVKGVFQDPAHLPEAQATHVSTVHVNCRSE